MYNYKVYHNIYIKKKEKKYEIKAYSMKDLINLTKYIKILLSLLPKQFILKCKKGLKNN